MFATLHAGIGVKKTHSYARSLIKYEYDTDWHSEIDGTDVGLCL